jgi:hypothetical protein
MPSQEPSIQLQFGEVASRIDFLISTPSQVYRRYVLAVLLVLNKFVLVGSRYYNPFEL